MKKANFLLTSLLVSTFAFAQKATDNFTGKYKTDDGGIITIVKTSTGFVGTDETKKIVLKDVKFDGKEWKATIINPKKDITASGEILLVGNKLKIVAHKGFLSKTIYWDVVK
jgi:uncharacterized protein (DUF2147 family)